MSDTECYAMGYYIILIKSQLINIDKKGNKFDGQVLGWKERSVVSYYNNRRLKAICKQ